MKPATSFTLAIRTPQYVVCPTMQRSLIVDGWRARGGGASANAG